MFKEALIGIFILFLFSVFCITLKKKKKRVFSIMSLSLLGIFCLANIIYNAYNIFPDFYMDIVNGRFRYGTFSGNLFAYSDEFMFQDEILFPVLRNRHVALDDTASFYETFFRLYSESTGSLSVSKENLDAVREHAGDFTFSHEFSCIGIMDYAADFLPEELEASFEEEVYPMVHINISSLKGNRRLVTVMDQDYTLYIMSEQYYNEITGGNPNG